MSKKIGFGKFLTGAAVGAGLALMFAPKEGKETRKELKKFMDDMLAKIDEIDAEEVKKYFILKYEQVKVELENLDREKALNVAKKTAKELQKKAGELADYAAKKGTPILKDAANKLREQALVVAKEAVNKLEKKEQ
jgi:gas vesicle protein